MVEKGKTFVSRYLHISKAQGLGVLNSTSFFSCFMGAITNKTKHRELDEMLLQNDDTEKSITLLG